MLISIAVVVVAFPATVVVGGYLPDLPTIGRFGVYLTTDLPAVVLMSLGALVVALVALAMGGARFTKLLVGAIGVAVAGSLLAGGRLWLVANNNGAAYLPFRQLGAPPDSRAPDQRLVFATVAGTELHADVWSAVRAAGSTGSAPGPALVFVHGGAFVAGELGSRPWLFRSLADAGVPVIDIEYRLAPPPRWHDAPADVLCALAWVHGQAGVLSIDPARVVLMGDSAGGSLALVAGYAAGTDRIAPSCPGTPVIPAGIIAIEPAADLEGIWQDGTISDGQTTFPEAYIGGPPAAYPERYAAASPFDLIRPGLPPTLIVTGANDHLVRVGRVASIVDALRAGGVPTAYIVIPFGDHGLDGSPTSAGAQLLQSIVPAFVSKPGRLTRP